MRDLDGFVMGLRNSKGRIVAVDLIDPATRRLVPLDDRRADGGMVVVTMLVFLVFGIVIGLSLAAWVLA